VVKQLLLSPEQTFERKAKEIILALELESKLSKDDILYLYLNHIYFGAGTYGISAAAQTLFGKEVGELSLAQAALLAGLPQAPSRFHPMRSPEAAIDRQHYVLDRMVASGFITPEERDAALAEPLSFMNIKAPTYAAAPWYVEHVRRLLEEQYGPEYADLGLHVHTAGDSVCATARCAICRRSASTPIWSASGRAASAAARSTPWSRRLRRDGSSCARPGRSGSSRRRVSARVGSGRRRATFASATSSRSIP
jgi:membrane carboxypeptidase/penicillin-binding protein